MCISDLKRLKLFEIAVCSARFDFIEISTPVRRIMLTMEIHSLNYHFRHGAHRVYTIYDDLKLFEIQVCFPRFCFFEISTLVMCIMLTMANIVSIIISDVARTVDIRLTVISNFSKLQFFCPFSLYEISTPVMRIMLTRANIV